MDLVTNAFAFVSKFEGVISPAYFNLKNKPLFNNDYYKYYFQLQYWNSSFFHHGKGVSIEHRWTLNEETFKNFPLPIPPLSEQTTIANYLDHKTAEIDKLIAEKNVYSNFTKKKKLQLSTKLLPKDSILMPH
ncbi:MAG: restriction endonuclease subunit S [Tannerellaceae bacterium]|nr:restriction endonuclease subunit S [Tannerellaceae bacterium]